MCCALNVKTPASLIQCFHVFSFTGVGSLSCGMQYYNTLFPSTLDCIHTAVYTWYETAGFQDLSEVPFYSREESISKYGVWEDDEDSSTAASEHKLPWDEVCDALSKNFPDYFRFLVDLSPPSFNNWAELAEAILKGNEKVHIRHMQCLYKCTEHNSPMNPK